MQQSDYLVIKSFKWLFSNSISSCFRDIGRQTDGRNTISREYVGVKYCQNCSQGDKSMKLYTSVHRYFRGGATQISVLLSNGY